MSKDLEFLAKLEKKLHGVKECHGSGYWERHKFYVDEYTDEKMSEKEIEKVLEISKKNTMIIYPINTCMGFSVGCDFCEIKPNGKRKPILRFKEAQLPKGYTFKKMSKTFMSKDNLKKAKLIDEEIVNSHEHYDY